MPVWVLPGTADDVVVVHFGYGRRRTGRVGTGLGVDTFGLRTSRAPWFDGGAQVTVTVTIEREGGTKPACVAEWVTRHFV